MRVIAGTARSLPLKTPASMDTRPTTDRIKETLFNMIQMDIPGCIFADFFAGSGGIGIEALSRGAEHSYFIENNPKAISCIQDNLQFTKFADRATLIKGDVLSGVHQIHEKEVSIIFMDPPYTSGIEPALFRELRNMPYVTENTTIILEASIDRSFTFLEEFGFTIVREKNYKTNKEKKLKKAIYPGSFDPVHYGHLDVIRRAAQMFDELTVSVLNNKVKTPLFSVEERVKILKEAVKDIPNVKVESFSGLLVDYAKEKDVHVVIRGLRAITDFEYELQTAQTNAKLSNGAVDTVFLTTGLEYAYLSSSSVKEIASFGGDISMCVPDFLGKQIYDKYGIERNEPEAME